MEGEGFRGKAREDIKRMSRNSVRKVRDDSNSILYIGDLIRGCVNQWGNVRKIGGRVRT
jgi:hypothetical protein